MAGGESVVEHHRPEPTEASPLLGSEGETNSHTSSTVASSHATPVGHDGDPNGSHAPVGNGANPGEEGPREVPKMHLLLPALAIGIFLSALDQTLIVATYAKMSSDLHALNRTSWISTA